MKIIVVGCGKVGIAIVEQLVAEGHTVTVVDNNKERLGARLGGLDVLTYCGDGCSSATLDGAGIKDTDLFIAAMDTDETNLLSCVIAKKKSSNRCKTIARVRNPIYSMETNFLKQELDIDIVVNPELATADEFARIFKFPYATQIDTFYIQRAELVHFKIKSDSKLKDVSLMDIRMKYNCKVLICMVERGDEVFIPDGHFVLKEGDMVGAMGNQKDIYSFFQKFGFATKKASNVIIVGGGKTGYYVARNLINSGITVKIIEIDRKRCDFLSENLEGIDVICGDGTTKDLLIEEGIQNAAGLAALTDIDEENLLLSLNAKSITDVKTATKVSRTNFEDVIGKLNLDTIIFPNKIVSDRVLQFVRSLQYTLGSNIESFRRLGGGKAEALGFKVTDQSNITGKALMDIKIKKNVLICLISRNGKNIIPSGSDTIEVDDRVVIVHSNADIKNIDDILEN
ncbi:MAG: Trk system potassium transporter TrkA [Lachnospiraceae bacterium]|nr:Trk system potassium transporter TrkA [Lachnospiraceae bacterium]